MQIYTHMYTHAYTHMYKHTYTTHWVVLQYTGAPSHPTGSTQSVMNNTPSSSHTAHTQPTSMLFMNSLGQ